MLFRTHSIAAFCLCLPAFLLFTAPASAMQGMTAGEVIEEEPLDVEPEPEPGQAPQAKTAKEEPEPPPPEEEPEPAIRGIRLQGLNKVTARISMLEGALGTVLRFGNLEIIPRRCWKAPPEERPENAALLEIWENRPDEGPQRIFSGWMFSSSPALSSLEHPVYDITVIACTAIEEGGEDAPAPAQR